MLEFLGNFPSLCIFFEAIHTTQMTYQGCSYELNSSSFFYKNLSIQKCHEYVFGFCLVAQRQPVGVPLCCLLVLSPSTQNKKRGPYIMSYYCDYAKLSLDLYIFGTICFGLLIGMFYLTKLALQTMRYVDAKMIFAETASQFKSNQNHIYTDISLRKGK